MNTDEFEKRMQQQPFKRLPPEWRTEVLAAANRNASSSSRPSAFRDPVLSLRNLLLSLRWHLVGLSAVWFFAIILNVASASSSGTSTALALKRSVQSQPLSTALLEHYRQLVEWIDPRIEDPVARPPRRSQLRVETAFV